MSGEGKNISATDQASAEVARTIVPMLGEQFKALLGSGFNREEALVLTRDILAHILTLAREKGKKPSE